MGVLHLYSRTADVFDHDAEIIGRVFAAHAAVAMSNAREVEGLKVAIESRGVIERAKGIIMASTGARTTRLSSCSSNSHRCSTRSCLGGGPSS